jgi:uncharacterized Tic20 family protein
MNIADELQKLQQLRDSGAISEEEFTLAKANLLSPPPGPGGAAAPLDAEKQTRQWAMFLHLSQLASFVVPLAGLVVPILIWQIKKAELPGIDVHGKIVVNWIISAVLYGFVSCILVFVLVGIPLLVILVILAIVFPIIGGVKANDGEAWKYPLSIPFFK